MVYLMKGHFSYSTWNVITWIKDITFVAICVHKISKLTHIATKREILEIVLIKSS